MNGLKEDLVLQDFWFWKMAKQFKHRIWGTTFKKMDSIQSSNQNLNRILTALLKISVMLAFLITSVVISGFALPYLRPNLAAVIIRADSSLFWYLARGSAIIGFILLWLSTIMGLMITTKVGKSWPGYEDHQ